MRAFYLALLLLCLPLAAFTQTARPKEKKLIPYDIHVDDLPNGLRLVTIPTDYPNLVALYIVVQTGSRNEVEPGKSGYAHFFEHLMFRGSKNYTSQQRDDILKRAGASSNANTSDDRTIYHEVFSKEDLDKVMSLEADRFKDLKYDETGFKTEALAILGEYNKSISNPVTKLHEVVRETAFDKHTYSHTTLGFLEDIKDMPNQYQYSLEFYSRYYRPEYTTIMLVGDVSQEQARTLTQKYFGDWKRGNYKPEVPVEPVQGGPRSKHVEWESETLPYVWVAFRGPAYSDTEKDSAALDLLSAIAFGPNSDIYQRLVLKEQKADFLQPSFDSRIDPELFSVIARVKDPKDTAYIQQQILDTFQKFASQPVSQAQLDATRSRLRYATALGLDSSEAIAEFLAEYVALTRTPETVNRLFDLYQTLTPEDLRSVAVRYFKDDNRTIVTLAHKGTTANGGQN